jgi:hypothetical protein
MVTSGWWPLPLVFAVLREAHDNQRRRSGRCALQPYTECAERLLRVTTTEPYATLVVAGASTATATLPCHHVAEAGRYIPSICAPLQQLPGCQGWPRLRGKRDIPATLAVVQLLRDVFSFSCCAQSDPPCSLWPQSTILRRRGGRSMQTSRTHRAARRKPRVRAGGSDQHGRRSQVTYEERVLCRNPPTDSHTKYWSNELLQWRIRTIAWLRPRRRSASSVAEIWFHTSCGYTRQTLATGGVTSGTNKKALDCARGEPMTKTEN